MNGVELCKKIRIKDRISIIHALTGYSNHYGLLESRTAGFDDFFVKPVKLDVIFRAAQDAFEKLARWKFSDLGLT